MGYSMGSRLAIAAAMKAPKRFATLTVGGVGDKMFEPRIPGNPMAEAMEAADIESIKEPMLKSFRQFADEQGEDRRALAAFVQAENPPLDRAALGALPMPVLVVAGSGDEGAGDPADLARVFPMGHGRTIPGCDHFSAIPHALTKAAVFDFIDGVMDEDEFPPFE
jgi:pimeloyl-ACP methyl ester carboxylesterase